MEDITSITFRPARGERLLAQTAPGAATYSAAYTVAAGLIGVVTCIVVCNTAGASTFRIHHSDSGGAAAAGNALSFDEAITANQSIPRTYGPGENGIVVAAAGIIYAGSASGSLTFSFYGYEITVT